MQVEAGTIAASDISVIEGLVRSALLIGESERWCNLTFEIDEDDPAAQPDSPLFSIVAARGPSSPLATVMGARTGKRPAEAQLGLQHRAGQKAARQLADAGIQLPDDWRFVQDHPRRGLVIELPEDVEVRHLVEWLLPVMYHFNRAPITGRIVYELFDSG